MDMLIFIHLSLDQPSACEFTKVYGAAVTCATAGVSAPRILLGPCSKTSACWHLPFLQTQKFIIIII